MFNGSTVPINQMAAGIIAVIAITGTVVLASLNRMIPAPLVAIDGVILTYLPSAFAFNIGVQHGIETAQKNGK